MRALRLRLPLSLSLALSQAVAIPAVVQERDEQMARVLAADFARSVPVLRDAVIGDYVNRLAVRIARTARLAHPVSVEVFHDPKPLLAALPQGYLFLSAGLLAAVENEAELAAALAHQVAHLAAEDHLLAHASTPTPVVMRDACARLGGSAPLPGRLRQDQDQREARADAAALELLRKLGYDRRGLAAFYVRVISPDSVPETTLASLRDAAPPAAEADAIVSTDGFAAMQERLKSLRPPRRPPSLLN